MARRSLLLVASAALVVGAGWSSQASPSSSPCWDAALVSVRTGKVLRRFSPGSVAVADGRGGWFVAGAGVERLRSAGRVGAAWRAQLPRHRTVTSLVRVGDTLYLGDGRRVFALAAATGALLWSSQPVAGQEPSIVALAASRSTVYLGGRFTRFGHANRAALAALNAATGRLLPWRGPALSLYAGSHPVVTALAVGAERLYFGGTFTRVGGRSRTASVAAVRVGDGKLTAFVPRSRIFAPATIVLSRGRVLIGGPEGGGVFRASTGALVSRMKPLEHANVISVGGSIAYLGGTLRDQISGHNLLALDLRSGKLEKWSPNVARYVSVETIALSGGKAFIGGELCSRLS
jgi:outer membrane protein assembly factor BamB